MDDAPKLLPPAPALAPPWLVLAALAGGLVLQGVTLLRQAPPASQPATAPGTEFSAERAAATLARVLGDEAPHPVGTPANAAVRERLLAELRGLGCAPEIQAAWAWAGGRARGAFVRNVIARLPEAAPTSGQLRSISIATELRTPTRPVLAARQQDRTPTVTALQMESRC